MSKDDKSITFEKLISYVYDDMPQQEKEAVEQYVFENTDSGRILMSLFSLKKKYETKEALKRFLNQLGDSSKGKILGS